MNYNIKETEKEIILEVELPVRKLALETIEVFNAESARQILLDNNVEFGIMIDGNRLELSNNFSHHHHRGRFCFAKVKKLPRIKKTGEKSVAPKRKRRSRTNKLLGTEGVE